MNSFSINFSGLIAGLLALCILVLSSCGESAQGNLAGTYKTKDRSLTITLNQETKTSGTFECYQHSEFGDEAYTGDWLLKGTDILELSIKFEESYNDEVYSGYNRIYVQITEDCLIALADTDGRDIPEDRFDEMMEYYKSRVNEMTPAELQENTLFKVK